MGIVIFLLSIIALASLSEALRILWILFIVFINIAVRLGAYLLFIYILGLVLTPILQGGSRHPVRNEAQRVQYCARSLGVLKCPPRRPRPAPTGTPRYVYTDPTPRA